MEAQQARPASAFAAITSIDPYCKKADYLSTLRSGVRVRIPFKINATQWAAGTPVELIAPIAGRICKLETVVQVANDASSVIRVVKETIQDVPGALTDDLAAAGAGLLTNGAYTYKVTFATANGETPAGTVSGGVTVADASTNGKVALTAIPLGPTGTTARKVYRTVAAGGTHKLLTTISDNTTTIYTDNIADASLGANAPLIDNTTGINAAGITLTVGADAAGTVDSVSPLEAALTTSNAVAKGQKIEILCDGAPTAGSITGILEISPDSERGTSTVTEVGEPYLTTVDVVQLLKQGTNVFVPFSFTEAELAGGTSVYVPSPVKGDIIGVGIVAQKTIASGAATGVSVEIATVAVVGLSAALGATAVKGSVATDYIAAVASSAVGKDDDVEIVPVTLTGGQLGEINGWIEIAPAGDGVLSAAELNAIPVTGQPYFLRNIADGGVVTAAGLVRVPFSINNTDYAAPTDQQLVMPVKGDVVKISAAVTTQTAGAGVVTPKIASTQIGGLALSIAGTTVVGTMVTDSDATVDSTNAVEVGTVVKLVTDATPTAGAINGYLEIRPR